MIHTFNEYHLGDNLIHLNYLRKVATLNPGLSFTHYCLEDLIFQLSPLTEGVDITLKGLAEKPDGAINAWIGENRYFDTHPNNDNWVVFHLHWFEKLSASLGVSNPIGEARDLLFDYPELGRGEYEPFDYLVINSIPLSGQVTNYQHGWFDPHVKEWVSHGLKVITTYPTGVAPCTLDMGPLTVSQIGQLSRYCKHIFGIATGPIWPTFNTLNLDSIESRTVFTFQSLDLAPRTRCVRHFY